jgi:hypothetical protein
VRRLAPALAAIATFEAADAMTPELKAQEERIMAEAKRNAEK